MKIFSRTLCLALWPLAIPWKRFLNSIGRWNGGREAFSRGGIGSIPSTIKCLPNTIGIVWKWLKFQDPSILYSTFIPLDAKRALRALVL
jgi:hypothetical protein